MNKFRRLRKNQETTKKNINKIRSLILKLSLVMLNFIFATFAWFSYSMNLDATVDVKVSTWKVDFKDDTTSITGEEIQLQLDTIYPGMDTYSKQINIENLGERAATLSYEVTLLKILGNEYVIKDTVSADDSEYTVYKSETAIAGGKKQIKLLNDSTKFPFEITITISTNELGVYSESNPNQNKGNFKIDFEWPYELPDSATEEEKEQKDALDTKWGYDTAIFYEGLPAGDTTKAVEVTVQTTVKQII